MNLASIISAGVISGGLLLPTVALAQFRLNEPTFFETGNEQFNQEIDRLEQSQPTPVLTVDTGVQQWQPVTSLAGGFSVWVPLGVFSDDLETVSIGEESVEFRILSSQASLGKFVVAYADLPDVDFPTVLADVQDGLVARTEFEVDSTEPVEVDGGAGQSVTLSHDDEVISANILVGSDRIYVVGVRYTDSDAAANAANQFLQSFQIMPN